MSVFMWMIRGWTTGYIRRQAFYKIVKRFYNLIARNPLIEKILGHRTFVWVTSIYSGHALMIWNALGFLLG